eukprot:NODE_1870_length_875_cov_292.134383_g1304_i0.p1 GENE.NODE_1870_length_875_cov_292.134383_g1304_i0~~NODE_1870_length_875_cov_292.134383_g1304_i0.p1  ORF type:complete len:241 (+),score=79.51 NODE_1870_length_875_cov_292.134383_g1304_i0:70-723(+)
MVKQDFTSSSGESRHNKKLTKEKQREVDVIAHRKLRYHEKKLLKKHHGFTTWVLDDKANENEIRVMRKYVITDREDYSRYRKLAGKMTQLAHTLKYLDASSKVRIQLTKELLEKAYHMGLIDDKSNLGVFTEHFGVSNFARRRLPVVMKESGMVTTIQLGVTYVQQGHVRVGPDKVEDPAFLVPRPLQDYITWMPQSKIGATVQKYRNALDDYDVAN